MTAGGASASELPTGTVTFVFTDIEGSTRLLSEIGSERFAERLMEHRRLVRAAVDAHGGVEVGTRGDSFFVVFLDARDALAAAGEIQHGLRQAKIRVRMGIHTGQPLVSGGDYVGLDVHKAARISAAAHGGQVLVSQTTRDDAGVELRDLGEHRLKDLSAPERLFQLGDGDFPPLRTLFHTNLPVQPTPLFGRQAEMAELVGLAESHRLLTITGLGGMGKTRLALELAGALADKHPDGVWWVPLAAITDAHLVMPAITSALDVSGDVTEYLAQRRLLLLLDNLEQVLDAGPYIAELLSAAPGVHVLATSRERLGLAAEQEFPLSPLSEPGAAELFVTRARQVKPDFQPDATIAEICRRLDRWPLALELASTRVKLMSTAQMLSRLSRRFDLLAAGRRDVPKRQSMMRATRQARKLEMPK